jgi:hypothetical protein
MVGLKSPDELQDGHQVVDTNFVVDTKFVDKKFVAKKGVNRACDQQGRLKVDFISVVVLRSS